MGKTSTKSAFECGMRGDEKPRRGPLRSVRVELADNGYLVHHSHEPGKNVKGDTVWDSAEKKPKVFTDIDELMKHLRDTLKK